MAQTTNQVPLSCGKLELSFDSCATWYDASGETVSLAPPQQTRMSGETYTLDGDNALIGGGKKEPMELVFVIVYTEADAEAYERIREAFETTGCGGTTCARWSPRGGSAGHEQITTATGTIISFTYPPMDATTGGVILGGFTLKVPYVTTTIVAS